MVYQKNAVSAGFDMLTLPQSAAPQKAQSGDEKESFRSMMDKNVKDAQNTAKEQPKAEQKEEAPEVTEEMPEQEQDGLEAGLQEMAAQAAVQLPIFPEQERAALNWGEVPEEVSVQTEGKAVEAVVQEQTVVVQGAQQQMTDNAKTQQAEGQAVQTEQPVQQQTVQVTQTAQKPEEQQPAENKEQQGVVLKQETAETKAVVQQSDLQEQDAATTETEVDAEEMMTSAPKETVSKETELVQVKVSDKVNLASANAAEELAETVLVKVAENTNEYELQLTPEELGKIKIKLVIQDGKISVAMSCENQKAADLLAATGGRLKAVIEERTGSEVFVQVEHEENFEQQERQGQSNGRGQEEQKQQQQETSPEELANFMQQLRLGLLNLT